MNMQRMSSEYNSVFEPFDNRSVFVTEGIYNDIELSDDIGYCYEATSETHIMMNYIYPKVEATLNDPAKARKFQNIVGEYVNNNQKALSTPGPQYLLTFVTKEKEKYYALFGISESEIKKVINEATKNINAKAQWQLIKNNPIFVLFYAIARYYTLHKDQKGLNAILSMIALSNYPSIFSKYFQYEPNEYVMMYTIDNLSAHFVVKKSKTIFGALMMMVQNSYSFHEKGFIIGSDAEIIRFIQRIRNDQNSFMKNIYNEFRKNYEAGLGVSRQAETMNDEDNTQVIDNENNTNRVERVSIAVVTKMQQAGPDLKLCQIAARANEVSMSEIRLCVVNMLSKNHINELRKAIEALCFAFLYETKAEIRAINSQAFLEFGLKAFKVTNTKNANILLIKNILSKWCEDFGINKKFQRLPTRSAYAKAMFMYILLSVQKYNN
jgi:hypothetical protein